VTSAEGQRHRVGEFSNLGGVTVKALRHYEKIGLLKPARTSCGHRVYSMRDLDRLRNILALKRVGLALTQMRTLLDAGPGTLVRRLTARRDLLGQERERVLRADRAIALVQESLRHTPADGNGLSRLADVIDMQRDAGQMKRYFSRGAAELATRFYQDWPTEDWIGLYRQIVAAIPNGPESARAEELLHRWNALARSLWDGFTFDPTLNRKLHEGFARAWRDRDNWPATIKRRFADYRVHEIAAFLERVASVEFRRRHPR
jgi:DNA-binding transcriptional MerR regulator